MAEEKSRTAFGNSVRESSRTEISLEQWAEIRSKYVTGVMDDGSRRYISLDELAEQTGIKVATLNSRSAREGWMSQRIDFQKRLEETELRIKRDRLAKTGADFDLQSLKLALALQAELAQMINQSRADRDRFIQESEIARREGKKPPTFPRWANATSLQAMASALAIVQRVGRLVLGESTDNQSVSIHDRREVDEAKRILGELARRKREDGVPVVH